MPRLLSNVSGSTLPKENFNERVEYYYFKDDKRFKSSEFDVTSPNGFYKTKSGKNIFLFDYEFYVKTKYMSAWCYYNFATNFKKKKMNGDQYTLWRSKMDREGKGWMLYDYL